MQPEEIGARSGLSVTPKPEFGMPVGVSSLKTGALAPPSKCPTNVICALATCSCQEMYGTLPENVMSGRVASFAVFDKGWPPLKSAK